MGRNKLLVGKIVLTFNCRHDYASLFDAIDLSYECDGSTNETEHVWDADKRMRLTVDILYFFGHGCVGFDKKKT